MWRPMLPIFWFALGAGCGWLANRCWPGLSAWFVRHAGIVLLVLTSSIFAVSAQQHDHSALGKAGEFYSTWKMPSARQVDGSRHVSCCNKRDCAPATMIRRDGKWFVVNHKMAPGREVEIPDNLIESNQPDPRESPDGRSHVCIDPVGRPLCAVLGSDG